MQKQRKQNLKRTVCILLVLSMFLTVLPFAALAASEEGTNEAGLVGIMPLSTYRPIDIPATVTVHVDVFTEAQLRTELDRTDTRTIRVMNDINITGSEMRVRGTKYVYSNSATPYSITRTSGTGRHINVSTGAAHLYNVRLTRTPGTRLYEYNAYGQLEFVRHTPGGPSGYGGGAVVSGGHLHLHSGVEISHNRASGRGGGISITSGTVTMNAGSLIYSNTSNHPSASGTGSGGGGGVSVSNGGTLNVNNGTIENNLAARGHGGGIQVAAGTSGSRAVLNINSIYLLDNEARLNAAGTQGGNGGGIHSNGHSTITIGGVSTMEGNRANNGGAMRIFSGSSQNFTLGAGSRIVNNVATNHGAGISIAHTGTGGTDSNANVIGLRVTGTAANPVLFEGNRAIGTGGAIHHEGVNITSGDRGLHITHAIFRDNRASDGGAISLALNRNDANTATSLRNTNLLTNAATTALRITHTTFEGNSATNGLLVDENLAAWNAGSEHFVGGQVGSVDWFGVRTNTAGALQEVGMRNHIWNNYDVVTRNRIAARTVDFEVIGTASASSLMEAEQTHTVRSGNPTELAVSHATPVEEALPAPGRTLQGGETVLRDSRSTFRITYIPWNADVTHWINNQTIRSWVGDPVTGSISESTEATVMPGSAGLMTQTGVLVNEHTLIQPVVDYREHNIVFTASPSTLTTGGTVDGEASITRTLRASRSAAAHAGYTGPAPRGNPMGLPPVTAARENWVFVGWSGPILDSNGDPLDTTGMTIPERIAAQETAIAGMYVTGNMTFVANFELRTAHALQVTPTSATRGNLEYADFTAVVVDQFGDPMVNQNSFAVSWSSEDTAIATISPASNPVGQANTTRATVTLSAAEGSSTTINASTVISGTTFTAYGTLNVSSLQIPNSIRVTPIDNYVFRGGNALLTAEVLDQFGAPMPNQNSFAINWVSVTPANVTINPTSNAAGQANTTTATATATAVMASENTVTATLAGSPTVTGSATVTIGTTYGLQISYRARNTPTGMTVTAGGTMIASNTAASVATHQIIPNDPVALFSGSAPNQTFLGWRTHAEYLTLPINTDGNRYIPGFVAPVDPTSNFNMPAENRHMVALWGNQDGEVTQYNFLDVTFNANHGATPATSTQRVTFNGTYTAAMAHADVVALESRTGFVFGGWFTSAALANGTTDAGRVQPGDTVTNANNHTLFARWIARTDIQVTFNANHGATPATATHNVTFASPYAAAMGQADVIALQSRNGFNFGGWFTSAALAAGTTQEGRVLPETIVTNADNHTLYARWTERTGIQVTFNANHGTPPATATQDVTFNGTYAAAMGHADVVALESRTGFNFGGWFTSAALAAGTTEEGRVLPGTTVTNADDHTLFARWIARSDIAVTFNANHGVTPATATHNVTFGGTYATAMSQANVVALENRTGFNFGGWFTSAALANGTTDAGRVTSSTEVTNADNHTLYARWIARSDIAVTFNANHGTTPATATHNVTFGGTYAAAMGQADVVALQSRTGYNFGGWFTSAALANGDTQEGRVLPATEVVNADNHTLFARWTARSGIQVTFNANHGLPPATATHGVTFGGTYAAAMGQSDVAALENRTGFNFGGWFTSAALAAGTTEEGRVLPGTTVTNADDHTLFARWIARSDIAVTFNANHGATPATATHNVTFGGIYAAAMGQTNVVALQNRTGYNFGGWFTTAALANGDTQEGRVLPDTAVTNADNHTLFARWTARTGIQVTFNSNHGVTPATSTQGVTFGGTYAAAMSHVDVVALESRTGFNFGGWFTSAAYANGTTDAGRVNPSTIVTNADDHTLFARWTARTDIAVTFSANHGAIPATETHLVTFGGTYEAAMSHPAVVALQNRTGFTFEGWFTSAVLANGDTQDGRVLPTTQVTNADNHTLYARWTARTGIQVTFNANHGMPPATATQGVTFGGTYAAAMGHADVVALESRTGFNFGGWFTSAAYANGTTDAGRVNPSTIVTNADDHTLFARWTARTDIAVTFNANHGLVPATATHNVTFNGTYAVAMGQADVVALQSRTGYNFGGWFSSEAYAAGTTQDGRVVQATQVTNADDHTLFARWTARTDIAVTFNANGGTPVAQTQNVTFGGTYAAAMSAITSPTQGDWVLQGWFSAAAGGVRVLPTTQVTRADDHVLFAQWERSARDIDPVVRFMRNDGSDVVHHRVTVRNGDTVVPPITPTRDNYVFIGWSTVANDPNLISAFNFGTAITANRDLFAQWEAGDGTAQTYVTVDFIWNRSATDTAAYRSVRIASGTMVGAFADPLREHYTFIGWSTQRDDLNLDHAFNFNMAVTTNMTAYAQWSANSVNVTFNSNGGSPFTPQVRAIVIGNTYAAAMAAITEPTRSGWVFQGWFTASVGGTRILPETRVTNTSNHTLYAQWERSAGPLDPVVRFMRNDGTDVVHHRVTVHNGDPVVRPIDPTRDDYVFIGWSTVANDPTLTNAFVFSTAITANLDLFAQWEAGDGTEHTYVTVDFLWNRSATDTAAYRSVRIAENTRVGLFADPHRDHYTFVGWSTQREDLNLAHEFNFATPVTGNMQVFAQWSANSVNVTFNSNGGSPFTPQVRPIVIGTTYAAAMAAIEQPTRSGWVFQGWFTASAGGTRVLPETRVTNPNNHTLYAQWERSAGPIDPVVRFMRNDGTDVVHHRVTVRNGDPVVRPIDPTRDDYVFIGWSTVANDPTLTNAFVFSTAITANLDLFAQWEAGDGTEHTYVTVDFLWNRSATDTAAYRSVRIAENTRVGLFADPHRDHYTFVGWSTQREDLNLAHPFNFEAPVTGNMQVFAQWSADSVNVTFNSNGGSPFTPQVRSIVIGTTYAAAMAAIEQPTRDGWVFQGWFTASVGGTRVLPETRVTNPNNHTLYAQWERSAGPIDPVVRFMRNDGTDVVHHRVTVRNGDPVVRPIDPTRDDHVFIGWSTVANDPTLTNAFVFSTAISANLDLFAQWEAGDGTEHTYVTVDFLWNRSATDTAAYRSVRIAENTTVGLFADPHRDHFTFVGWSTQRDDLALAYRFEFNVAVTTNMTVYAQWSADSVNVTFNSNGGSPFIPQVRSIALSTTYAAAMNDITTPERAGWVFQGWFTAAAGGTRILPETRVTNPNNHTLYAQWERSASDVDPVVRFMRNDGTDVVHHRVTVRNGDPVVRPIDPTRDDHVFIGWSTIPNDPTLTNAFVFSTAITANLDLFAQWEAGDGTEQTYVEVDFLWNRSATDTAAYRSVRIAEHTTVGPFADPQRQHFVFVGWSIQRDDLALDYEFDFNVAVTTNMTVYAQWSADSVNVTFNSNGGSPFIPQVRSIALSTTYAAVMNDITTPERAGWVFQGWFTAAEGGTRILPETRVTRTYNHTLYAQWERSASDVDPVVRFMRNDGTDVVHHRVTVRNGDPVVRPIDPTRDDYVFIGWSTVANDPTLTNAFVFSTAITANLDLFAQWEAGDGTEQTYVEVDFLWNRSATDTAAYRSVRIAEHTTVGPFADPQRQHFTFVGWSTQRDDLALDYEFDFDVAVTTNMTVYAQWSANNVSVTFNSNGGSPFIPQVRSVALSSTYAWAMGDIMTPERAGWIFQGWFTAAEGGTRVLPETRVTRTYNHTLFAQWERSASDLDPIVRFMRNDGETPPVVHHLVTVYRGDTVTPPIDPTRDDYVFIGWSTVPNDPNLDNEFAFGTAITANLNLYAQWEAGDGTEQTYVEVDFLWNRSAVDTAMYRSVRIAENTRVGLFADPQRQHFVFVGWSTQRDDLDLDYEFDFTAAVSANMTVYAQWSANSVDVTFHSNGGQPFHPQVRPVAIGGTYAWVMGDITTPTRVGWVFQGWFTEYEGGVRVLPTDRVIRTYNHELHAQWERSASDQDPVVRFMRNDGSGIIHHLVTVYSGEVVPPISPTRDDYVFIGWSTVANDPNLYNEFDFGLEIIADLDLYAQWEAGTGAEALYVEVYFLWNRDEVDMAEYRRVRIAIDTLVGLFGNPRRENYSFAGWSLERDDLDLNYEVDFLTAIAEDLVVYAQWIPETAQVRFFRNDGTDEIHYQMTVGIGQTATQPEDPVRIATYMVPLIVEAPVVDELEVEDDEDDEEYTVVDDEDELTDEEIPTEEDASTDEDVPADEETNDDETVYEDTYDVPADSDEAYTLTEGSTDTELPYELSPEAIEVEMVEETRTYIFMGWYTCPDGHDRFSFSTAITADTSLYARWDTVMPPLRHTVNFHRNDGTDNLHYTIIVLDGDILMAPAAPTRGGHIFRGWFTDAQATEAFTFGAPLTADEPMTLNLFAGWTPAPPPGGGGPTPPQQTVVLPDPPPPLAEWDGEHHAFLIGFADGTVRPRADVTRAQVATILFRLMTDESRELHWMQTNPFPDVILTNWHNNAVSTTFSADIFIGMPDGTFMPDRSITRAELATTIVRFMGVSQNHSIAQFNDISGHWAQGYINAAALNGWVIGDNGLGYRFRPNDTITRAEMAAIVNRAFGRLPHGPEDLLEGMRTWPDNSNQNVWYYLYIQEATNSHKYARHEDDIHESWVELITPERPWALLERPDSRPRDIFRAS